MVISFNGPASEQLIFTCYLNMSACHLKLTEWKEALTAATKALEIDKNSAKGSACHFIDSYLLRTMETRHGLGRAW